MYVRLGEFGSACSVQRHQVRPPPVQQRIIVHQSVASYRWGVWALLQESAKADLKVVKDLDTPEFQGKNVEELSCLHSESIVVIEIITGISIFTFKLSTKQLRCRKSQLIVAWTEICD